ncbi:MAG: hypothetical protein O2800_06880 [Planctomycetota bacterium]|nr:hypothetical protein [Planctomycetota bacterium]
MLPAELVEVSAAVRHAGDVIQPLLHPHPGLAKRNAFAHLWLGVKTRFGDDWRERASQKSVLAFVAWMIENPNADYEEYAGEIELSAPRVRVAPAPERTLFDP